MIPDSLTFVVLCLAAYRATRLVGWDDFPLAARTRAWVIGERWIALPVPFDTEGLVPIETEPLLGTSQFPRPRMQDIGRSGDEPLDPPSLPGKQPPSEVDAVRPAYDRPTLAHLVHCPFCIGWWISLATWVAWLAWHPVEYGLMPFAISGAVGLIAKNLDP